MNEENFRRALAFTLSWEGGWSNNSTDPGRETYCGISRRYWPDWPGWWWVDDARATFQGPNAKLLNAKLLEEPYSARLRPMVEEFYRLNFWNATAAANMPWPACLCFFDIAVRHGAKRAEEFFLDGGRECWHGMVIANACFLIKRWREADVQGHLNRLAALVDEAKRL